MVRLFIIALVLILPGCVSTSYFSTSNDVLNRKGTILFNDGTTLTGQITIPFENDFNIDVPAINFIYAVPEGETEKRNVPLSSIAGYYMDSNFYALKKVDLFVNNTNQLLFVKRLTGPKSKIQLYTLHQTGKGNSTGEEADDYFISLPGAKPYETINIRSNKLMPDFDLKMSALVSDCPALADKIKAREDDYFLPFVIFNRGKYKKVLLKIINEYDGCR